MFTRCRRNSSRRALLSLLLVALLLLPPAAFAAPEGALSAASLKGDPLASRLALLPSMPALVASIVVNTTGDGDNVDVTAGCDADAGTPGEQCTLRAAIERANTLAGDDSITFNIPTSEPGCDASTGACLIQIGSTLPVLNTNIAVNGPGPDRLTISRPNLGPSFRIFNVMTAGVVTLSGLRIENGDADAALGGGINSTGTGSVNIVDCVFFNSRASNGGAIFNTGSLSITRSAFQFSLASINGGAIYNTGTGMLSITDSMIGGANSADGEGGGIYHDSAGAFSITNSSVFGNFASFGSATGSGGAIRNVGTGAVSVSNCTFMHNGADSGGGISGPATVKNTIIAGSLRNQGPAQITDVEGTFTSVGFNFIGDKGGSTGFTEPTDQTGTSAARLDPNLIFIRFMVGSSTTNGILVPRCGSPVIDKATSVALTGTLTTDVRGAGFARKFDDPSVPNAAGGDGTDIGAFERPICTPFAMTVNTTRDDDDVNPGDAACDIDAATAGSQCTLRAAITEANEFSGAHTVNFAIPTTDPGFEPVTGRYTINLARELPDITTDLTFNGTGQTVLTVRRNSGLPFGIFKAKGFSTGISPSIFGDIDVAVFGMTISNGLKLDSVGGGGISFNNDGTLTVADCLISENFAQARGGGIAMFGFRNSNIVNGTLNVSNTIFRGNFVSGENIATSDKEGGAIFGGKMNISNSTFSDNAVGGNALQKGGGAIGIVFYGDGEANITNSTFHGNSAFVAGRGAAVLSSLSTLASPGVTARINITNSTFANNGSTNEHHTILNECIPCSFNVSNSTITNNVGSGLKVEGGTVQVKSSIIARNAQDVLGTVTSGGFNLIGNGDGSTGFANAVNNDQVGATGSPLDPKLDPAGLQNNGGPTLTIALLPNSLAIDKGTAASLIGALTTDQRGTGFARIFDSLAVTNAADGTDVGAFELNPAAPTPTPTPTSTPTPTPTSTPTPTPTPSPSPSQTPSPTPAPTPSPTPTPTPPTFQFDSPTYSIVESCSAVTVRVVRSGPTGMSASIDITSEDGTAKQKGDYNFVTGHLTFAPGETEKVVHVLINDDSYVEGLEFATLILQHPINGTLGAQSTAMLLITDNVLEPSTNPINDARGFVCPHYHDFLYRESDQAGEDFWTNQLEQCGMDAACLRSKRTDVSTAFFISIEFQQTGYFVIRSHKAAFGNLKSNPRYATFLGDQRHIGDGVVVGQGNWQQQLATNKQNYLADFVSRAEFVAVFRQGQPAAAYVDGLFLNAGVAPTATERNAAITAYGSGDTSGRAAALQSVVESGTVFNALYNPAFVLMQYYGYLRRNPDDLPDNNFNGYDFWLAKMNLFTLPGEDARNEAVALARVRRAEMVKAFIESSEYGERFLGSNTGNQQGVESIASSTPRALMADLVASRNSAPPFRFRLLRNMTFPNSSALVKCFPRVSSEREDIFTTYPREIIAVRILTSRQLPQACDSLCL